MSHPTKNWRYSRKDYPLVIPLQMCSIKFVGICFSCIFQETQQNQLKRYGQSYKEHPSQVSFEKVQ